MELAYGPSMLDAASNELRKKQLVSEVFASIRGKCIFHFVSLDMKLLHAICV